MPLFICDKCKCVDNTALGHFWSRNMDDMWKPEDNGKALCSVCAPKEFDNGEDTGFTGEWHGRFGKEDVNLFLRRYPKASSDIMNWDDHKDDIKL